MSRTRYVLDRIEGGLAVLQPVEAEALSALQIDAALLCAEDARPADGTVFTCDEAGQWHPDPEATAAREAQLRSRLQRLLNRSTP